MMPHETILDIMRRTMANLEFVQAHATSAGPYEVTQLINSFLGAMAHPWEHLREELDAITIDAAVSVGWPELHKERSSDRDPASLGDLIRLLRTGIAHGNLTFHPNGKGQIAALRIVNKDRQGLRTWGAIVTPADMRKLLEQFVALVVAMAASAGTSAGAAA